MVISDLIANQPHSVGHRRLVRDEVWCRMQFHDEADLAAFVRTLRWSAFRFEAPKSDVQPDTKPPETQARKSK